MVLGYVGKVPILSPAPREKESRRMARGSWRALTVAPCSSSSLHTCSHDACGVDLQSSCANGGDSRPVSTGAVFRDNERCRWTSDEEGRLTA